MAGCINSPTEDSLVHGTKPVIEAALFGDRLKSLAIGLRMPQSGTPKRFKSLAFTVISSSCAFSYSTWLCHIRINPKSKNVHVLSSTQPAHRMCQTLLIAFTLLDAGLQQMRVQVSPVLWMAKCCHPDLAISDSRI